MRAFNVPHNAELTSEWRLFDRPGRARDAGLPGLRPDSLLPNLHTDPRWDALLRTMGLTDKQLK